MIIKKMMNKVSAQMELKGLWLTGRTRTSTRIIWDHPPSWAAAGALAGSWVD
jgi:hypothetical protein